MEFNTMEPNATPPEINVNISIKFVPFGHLEAKGTYCFPVEKTEENEPALPSHEYILPSQTAVLGSPSDQYGFPSQTAAIG